MNEDFSDLERAARRLREEWESPELWPAIEARLRAEPRPHRRRTWIWVAAVAAMLVLSVTAGLLVRRPARSAAPPDFLTNQAMQDVEKAEAAYQQSIARLSQLVEPSLRHAQSPLQASYREKLALLDEAIGELRAEASANPYHAGVRLQLSALYREKQITLQEALRDAAEGPR